jgi:hypothetical protein
MPHPSGRSTVRIPGGPSDRGRGLGHTQGS